MGERFPIHSGHQNTEIFLPQKIDCLVADDGIHPGNDWSVTVESLVGLMKSNKNFLNDVTAKFLRKIPVGNKNSGDEGMGMTIEPEQKLPVGDAIPGIGLKNKNADFNFIHYLSKTKLSFELSKVFPVKPAVTIDFKTSRYHVKTATNLFEVWQALRLRNRIFFGEFAGPDAGRKISPIDLDKYDFRHDHLIVKDLKKNEVIATYRLRSTSFMRPGEVFYTNSEFDLTEFLKIPDGKLELGRAAVSASYRNGTTILLLWQGLFDYARQSNSRYLFGCSSLTPFQYSTFISLKKEWEEQGGGPLPFEVPVHPDFKWTASHEKREVKHDLGSLIGMYAQAGAKFGEEIAHDKEMDCLDVFTLLDLEKLPPAFARKLRRGK